MANQRIRCFDEVNASPIDRDPIECERAAVRRIGNAVVAAQPARAGYAGYRAASGIGDAHSAWCFQ